MVCLLARSPLHLAMVMHGFCVTEVACILSANFASPKSSRCALSHRVFGKCTTLVI